MKNLLITMLALFILIALAACDNGDNVQEEIIQPSAAPLPISTPEQVPEGSYEWTIEELGERIVGVGEFWEDWWNLREMFAFEHLEDIPFEEWADMPDHPASRGFSRFLPESGFENLDDIRNYLLQFHTENKVNQELSGEFSVFIEYADMLFVQTARGGFPRPDWETAEHTLIEEDGNRVVVETTVLWGSWHRIPYGGDAYPWEVLYRFTFIDGKIDAVENPDGIF